MRVQHFRNVIALRIWTQYETWDSRSVPELGPLVRRLGSRELPRFHVRRVDMVVPPAPIIPRYENCSLRPEPSLHNRIHLVHGPLHARRHVPHWALPRVRRMLVKLTRGIDP